MGVAIEVKSVSKTFRLPHQKQNSIKGLFVNMFTNKRTYERQQVLRNISFEVQQGEFFGIVGRNGSGKSTLLKILAGIYEPNEGHVTVNGRLTPFIELGVGFNPNLTGRENVYLNGALLGFSRKEMDAMYDEIVDFAELHKFMDQKLKNYSSGMQVRLAFSIAIRSKSDILLIDEVLAVGDTSFQRKCYEIFTALKKEGRTIVFVTHDMSAVERFCDKVLVVHKSRSEGVHKPGEASAIYDKLNASNTAKAGGEDITEQPKRWGNGKVMVDTITFRSDKKFLADNTLNMGDPLSIDFTFKSEDKPEDIIIGLNITDMYGVNISGPNSGNIVANSSDKVTYTVDKLPLIPGEYKMTVAVYDKNLVHEFDHLDRYYTIKVISDVHNLFGKVNLFGKWSAK